MSLSKDITEAKVVELDKKRAELQLQQESAKIDGILESITDGFFVLDQHFRVKLWNHEAETDYSALFPPLEMADRSIWEKLPEWADSNARADPFIRLSKRKMAGRF